MDTDTRDQQTDQFYAPYRGAASWQPSRHSPMTAWAPVSPSGPCPWIAFPDVTPPGSGFFTNRRSRPEEANATVTLPMKGHVRPPRNSRSIALSLEFRACPGQHPIFEDGHRCSIFCAQIVGERLSEARATFRRVWRPANGAHHRRAWASSSIFDWDGHQRGRGVLSRCARSRTGSSVQTCKTLPGVTEVLSLGGFEKQYQVRLDPDCIARLMISNRRRDQRCLERGNKTRRAIPRNWRGAVHRARR